MNNFNNFLRKQGFELMPEEAKQTGNEGDPGRLMSRLESRLGIELEHKQTLSEDEGKKEEEKDDHDS